MKCDRFLEKGRLDEWFPGCFGIYIHVPFCLRRCRYCAFLSSVSAHIPANDYVDAVLSELRERANLYASRRLLSVYFGGGTPTALHDDLLAKIVWAIADIFGAPSECTLEANPEHVTSARADSWKAAGFTRVSLGVQAFDDETLAFLGRKHTAQMAVDAVETIERAGFDETSVDLIYGAHAQARHTPPQDNRRNSSRRAVESWKKSLAMARSLKPAHVSCYELTIEPHTPLWTAAKRGVQTTEDDDTIADMMSLIPGALGMEPYEVSNYCRDGYLSAHNVSCWAGLPYLGLGAGAHSLFIDLPTIERRANTRDIRGYISSKGALAPEFTESLSPQTHLAERLICAARTRFAWRPEAIAQSLGADLSPFAPHLARAVAKGWLTMEPGLTPVGYRTTSDGMRLNNLLAETLFDGAPC